MSPRRSKGVAQRVVPGPGDPIVSSPATPGGAVIVPDARPGDLRVDPSGDVLPSDYVPGPAVTVFNDLVYGPDPIHRLDLHLPAGAGPSTPVLVYLHSGGWVGGDKTGIPDMVRRYVERGYALASVDYSLAPDHPFPAPVHDVNLAIRWLKHYAATEGVFDGDRMVLTGASAGGHLAAFAAATQGRYDPPTIPPDLVGFDTEVVGIVAFVAPTDLVQQYDQPHDWSRGITSAFAGCFPCTPEQLIEPSVATHLHADLVPAYWIYGEEDPLVDAAAQGVAIAEAWADHAGADRSWLDVVDGEDHDVDASQVNVRSLDEFVDTVTETA